MNLQGASPSGRCPKTRFVRRLLMVALLTYLGVCVFINFVQSRLIYFPSRDYHSTPADIGLDYEDLRLTTGDGVKIAAWYVPFPQAAGTIIFCHGNAGNMADRLRTIKQLNSFGCHVLIFDYRGYGRSEGSPTEEGTYLDAQAAWDYVTSVRGEASDRVILFGRSLGGAVAIDLADRCDHTGPAALIVESTFTSLVDIGRLHYPALPVSWLLRYRYDSIEKVGGLHCPKLFFHGTDDTLVPFTNGRRLFDAAAEPKLFVETPGDHNTAGFDYAPEYAARLASFIQTELNRDGA